MIVVRLNGGMGNQMFQYAFARSLSIEKGVKFCLDKRYLENRTPQKKFVFRNYDLSIFNIKEEFYKDSESISTSKFYADNILIKSIKMFPLLKNFASHLYLEPFFNFDKDFRAIRGNCYCVGYFQSYKYFDKIKDTILVDFSFKTPLRSNCNDLKFRITNTNSVCINIRRGDFLNNQYHGTVGNLYYYQAIDILQLSETDITIFVFSDDIAWCEQNLKFSHPTEFVSHEYAGIKFADYLGLMILCKHFIIPNSTFAWWAAFLSQNENKKIIAPKKWFMDSKIDTTDLIPGDWLRI